MKLRFEGCHLNVFKCCDLSSTLEMCLFDYLRGSNIILTILFQEDDIFQA